MKRASMSMMLVKRFLLPAVITCVLLASAAADQYDGLAVPLAGEPFRANLLKIDSQWVLTLDDGTHQRTIAAADLTAWGSYREDDTAARVVLRDGSVLVASIVAIEGSSVTVESAFWPSTKIPRESLAAVIFSPPASVRARDRLLHSAQTQPRSEDVILLHNGDQIAGRVTTAPESTATNEVFGLTSFGLALPAAPTKPIAITVEDTLAVLTQRDAVVREGTPANGCTWLGFQDGTLLAVKSIDARATNTQLMLSSGQLVTLPTDAMLRQVRFLQPVGNAARYLSDLTPVGFQHSPFLDLQRPLERDRNVLGGRLRSGGNVYLKGLGMPATARVIYRVAEADRRFAAELALDDAAGRQGSVVYRVFLEKQPVGQEATWQAAYTSQLMRGGDAPQPISIDLQDARQIALIVDFADHGDARDYANWLNARFLP